MKSGALLPSNLPSVIDRSNLSTSRESILIMTQLISFLHFLLTAVTAGRLGVLPIKVYRENNAVFVSVDSTGEKNQVILEL